MNLSIFVERLSELMFDAKLSVQALSKEIGCRENTIYCYLRGNRMPALDITIKLADYFKCSTDFLLGLETENLSVLFKKAPPFKERFPLLLAQCNTTQYQLEKLTGIAHSVTGYWKNGRKQPTIDSIIRIAKALDKRVDFVLGRTDS